MKEEDSTQPFMWPFILEHLGITVAGILGAGWAVYTQIDKRRIKLHITQSGNSITNQVYATELDMTGYRAEVKIINDSGFPVVLRGFDLELPWNDEDFRFLPDPRDTRRQQDYYEMPMTTLRWPMDDVINHRTFKNGKMEPGDVIEGFILAIGTTPIPTFYQHGDEIEMKFSVYDQRGKPHSIRLTFRVDVYARRFKMSAPELPEDSDLEAEERRNRKLAETTKKQIKVLVIGTDHNIQRHQDTDPELEKDRANFEKFLRATIEEGKIDLVAEEAGDDKRSLENVKRDDEQAAEFERQLRQMMERQNGLVAEGAGLFGKGRTVDRPVPTIAKTIADKRVRYKDVDVDIRVVDENDVESIKKRGDAIAEKILKVLGTAERVVVIVGELHRADVVQRLKAEDMSVECMRFPNKKE